MARLTSPVLLACRLSKQAAAQPHTTPKLVSPPFATLRILMTTLTELGLNAFRITPQTTWIFVSVQSDEGHRGLGEATLTAHDGDVARVAARAGPGLLGVDPVNEQAVFGALEFTDLSEAAFSSALMQALSDLNARAAGVSLAEHLGGARRDRIGLYANINRASRDRSPQGFVDTAMRAREDGFSAYKIAPFDEVNPDVAVGDIASAMQPGLARIAAVRDCVGDDARLMVDCHWRFTEVTANALVDAIVPFDLHWLECPIDETPEIAAALKKIRSRVNEHGVQLAGLEHSILGDGFMPFLAAGSYDVMMPDVKYAGGPNEMMNIASDFARYGVEFSPHNPSGPVAYANTLQICSALDDSGLLEMQYDETPLFDSLVFPALPPIVKGTAQLDRRVPGIGVALDSRCCSELEETACWSAKL